MLAFPDVLACTADKALDVKAASEWGGTTILSASSSEVVTVIVSGDKLTILTVPTGKMDLPACDAEAKRVAFQIVCAKVSSLDNQARALYIVVLMENSCSSGRAGLGSIGSSGSWTRRPAHMYVSPTFNGYCYSILNFLFIRHDDYLLKHSLVHQICRLNSLSLQLK
ncbi:hypothetical protein IEE_03971 [Bacillus cereus BAG5X1-1]|uniref:Uncharacterized protein n=1 Tax=Bacillus cereus BAG5X1-1 TaxID=1053189 RepID=J8A1E9_BACCE|nr:hypothetical protein IEE_03971 [Bacillus cereus BAG5X1-1]